MLKKKKKKQPYKHGHCLFSQKTVFDYSQVMFIHRSLHQRDFPGGSDGKASAYNAGDLGSIPGPGRSPGEGNGNPLQYSCLENPRDGGAWWAAVYGVTQSQTLLKRLSSSSSNRGKRASRQKKSVKPNHQKGQIFQVKHNSENIKYMLGESKSQS